MLCRNAKGSLKEALPTEKVAQRPGLYHNLIPGLKPVLRPVSSSDLREYFLEGGRIGK